MQVGKKTIYSILKKVAKYDEEKLARRGAYHGGVALIQKIDEENLLSRLVIYGVNNGFTSVKPLILEVTKIKKFVYGNYIMPAALVNELTKRYERVRDECVRNGYTVTQLPLHEKALAYCNVALKHTQKLSNPEGEMFVPGLDSILSHSREQIVELQGLIEGAIDGSSKNAAEFANGVVDCIAAWEARIVDTIEGSRVLLEDTLAPLYIAKSLATQWVGLERGVVESFDRAPADAVAAYDSNDDQLAFFA